MSSGVLLDAVTGRPERRPVRSIERRLPRLRVPSYYEREPEARIISDLHFKKAQLYRDDNGDYTLTPILTGGAPVAIETFATLAETTTTADPGAAGVALAVTTRTPFPASGQFRILVQNAETDKTNREIMLVTAGQGAGAGNFTVTRGMEGTAAVAHPVGSYVAQVLTADAQERWMPEYVWQPRHHNAVCWSFPIECIYGPTAFSSTTLIPRLAKCWVPETITITNISVYLGIAGATLTAGGNRLGVYSSAGVLLSQSADITAWALGVKTVALAAAQVIAGGPGVFVWLAMLATATTVPATLGMPLGGAAGTPSTLANFLMAAADNFRFGTLAAVVSGTGLPASFAPATGLTASNAGLWIAGS